jgi:hypothetical protein
MGLGFRGRFGIRILGRCDMILGSARFLVCFGVRSRIHVYSEVPFASPSRWTLWASISLTRMETGYTRHVSNKLRERVSVFQVCYQIWPKYDGSVLLRSGLSCQVNIFTWPSMLRILRSSAACSIRTETAKRL